MLMTIIKILFFIPAWLLFPTIFKGKRNIPKKNAILVCNHRSNLDCLILTMSTCRNQKYLAKKELFKNKCFGGILKGLGCIPIDRQKTDLTAIKLSLKVLKEGELLTIFPEGTRNKAEGEKQDDLQQVKAGACMLAIKSKSPIVPVWIKKKSRPFCLNTLRFGKAFTLEEFYDKKLDKETLDLAAAKLQEKMMENKIENKKRKK